MKIMSVDLGLVRTGVAVSDLTESFAFPDSVITERNPDKLIEKLSDKAKSLSAELIVVGLPRNMDGTEGFRADTVRAFVEILATLTDIPIDFYDERMTTMQAYRFLGETSSFGKKRKAVVDTLSAEIILQNYIDRERNGR